MNNDKFMEYMKKVELQMKNCNHLFVKLKKGQYYGGFHSSDCEYDPAVVICLKCSLTNKYIEMDDISRQMERHIRIINPYYDYMVKINDRIFREQFSNAWSRGGKSFDESVFNLISNEVFKSNHSTLLYKIAKTITPDANDQEIFEIMKKLNEIETPEERDNLKNMEQAIDLIDRFNNIKVKKL